MAKEIIQTSYYNTPASGNIALVRDDPGPVPPHYLSGPGLT